MSTAPRWVQATVRSFASDTGSGTVLLDDGTRLVFDHRAFDGSGLRVLRFGQRVRVAVADGADGPTVTALSLITMPAR